MEVEGSLHKLRGSFLPKKVARDLSELTTYLVPSSAYLARRVSPSMRQARLKSNETKSRLSAHHSFRTDE